VSTFVALEQNGEGTNEHVDADSSGRVRAIQRYYDSVTSALRLRRAASLVRGGRLRVSPELPLGSWPRLGRVLGLRGAQSRMRARAGAVSLARNRGFRP
jgi:hypothetical protein